MTEQNNPIWLLETRMADNYCSHQVAIDLREIASIVQSSHRTWQGETTVTLRTGATYKLDISYQDIVSQWRAALGETSP